MYCNGNNSSEEEEIFRSEKELEPKKITVTDEQKNDFLRKPKVILTSYLTAEVEPITSAELIERMKEDSKVLNYSKYGYQTMDELLQACSDVIAHKRLQDGRSIYFAKANEAFGDIMNYAATHSCDKERSLMKMLYESGFKNYGNEPAQQEVNKSILNVYDKIEYRKNLCARGTIGRENCSIWRGMTYVDVVENADSTQELQVVESKRQSVVARLYEEAKLMDKEDGHLSKPNTDKSFGMLPEFSEKQANASSLTRNSKKEDDEENSGFGWSVSSADSSDKTNTNPKSGCRGRLIDRAASAAGSSGRTSVRRQELSEIFGLVPSRPRPENSIVPLAEFVKDKRYVELKTLTPTEQMIVTHSKSIFNTLSTKIGETIVTIKDPNINVADLVFSYGDLRPMLEIDVIQMSENTNVESNRFLASIACFVPPRGFLAINREGSDNLEEISSLLRSFMQHDPKHLEFKDIIPGIACTYMYNSDESITFFRVIVVRKSGDPDKDLMVLLADATVKYHANVCINDLYSLPSSASFENIVPNVIFGTLCGVESIDQRGQEILESILDANIDKEEIPAYFAKEGNSNIPQLDFLCRAENNKIQWMSSLILTNGGKNSMQEDYSKEAINISELYMHYQQPDLIHFVLDNENSEENSIEIQEIRTDLGSLDTVTPYDEKFDICSLNVSNLFKKFVADRNMLQISTLFNLVDGLSADNETWRYFKMEMRRVVEDEFDMIL